MEKTFLDNDKVSDKKLDIETHESVYSVFTSIDNEGTEMNDNDVEKKESVRFLGPYERYKLVKPYIQEQERKEEAEKAKKNEENKGAVENPENSENRSVEQRIEAVGIYKTIKFLLHY